MGFGAKVESKKDKNRGDILKELLPEDLLKYGIIPELIGRLPIVTTLESLNEEALKSILREPKNALLKQYSALFDMDGVELEFEEPAISAIAKLAVERETGARGLRTIVEDIMLDIMYEIPSDTTIEKVVVTEGCVKKRTSPISPIMQPLLRVTRYCRRKTPADAGSCRIFRLCGYTAALCCHLCVNPCVLTMLWGLNQ